MTPHEILSQASAIQGWMEPEELLWLIDAAKGKKLIVEVGSWKGRSTKALALSCAGAVYAVDHWEGSEDERFASQNEAVRIGADLMLDIFKKNLAPEIASGKVIPIQADSEEAMPLVEKALAGRKADMVFLDGDHRYEPTKRDIENYRKFLEPGGLLCGHDYWHDHPGVVQAVNETVPGFKQGARAIWYKVE
jgi:predicted O-methyltransferase YrrM